MTFSSLVLAAGDAGGGSHVSSSAALIPFLPLLGAILCGVCAIFRVKSKLPAFLTVGCIGASFALTLMMFLSTSGGEGHGYAVVKAFDWINFKWSSGSAGSGPRELIANFSFYVDSLTCLWMLFVTGLGTLIALYASEYMAGDVGQGYCRFFAAFGLFVFSMACLVMGDNLVLLYLGWEGVGLCSYLLIGYFYKKPSAVAAAKKAFVMNRIGDLGLSMGLMLTFVQFGTVEYAKLFPMLEGYLSGLAPTPLLVELIPVLLTIGAFGKSAQLFLYVWLPDAMEGPTPVSALIHAATMVTAGVYLVARFMPVYVLSDWALPLVAWGGALTAFWAATIGMAQFDIKRIMAYSTVSQLGYMFAGLGVMGASGAASHVFTHAFFKALLFLACGAVMHGFAGQLDLRQLSGLRKMPGWKIVSYTMLVGCLNLAGVPFITSGFYSKDMILGDAFANHYAPIGWLLLITAGMTAYYTFRVFFRVFCGPVDVHKGDEEHGHDDHAAHGDASHAHADHSHADAAHAEQGFHPHAPGMAINLVLSVLAVASIAAVGLFYVSTAEHGWVGSMVHSSTASAVAHHPGEHEHAHATFFGMEAHGAMQIVSGVVAILGIAIAWYLHLAGRTKAATAPHADGLLHAIQRIPLIGKLPGGAQHKWYVDEVYNWIFYVPLRVLSHILFALDKFLVDGLVNLFGWVPRGVGESIRPTQDGVLHGYALRMLQGVALLLLIALVLVGGLR